MNTDSNKPPLHFGNGMRRSLFLIMILVALVTFPGCTVFIRWSPVYGGAALDREELSLGFGFCAMKCSFGLWNASWQPTARVEIKNLSNEELEYDFTDAVIASGAMSSVRKSTPDARGSLAPGKKVRLEIEFEKMIGVRQFVDRDGGERLKWNTSPLTIKLGTIVIGDTVLVVPDLMFADRDDYEFL